nr:hypothetical protein [Borreliella garinii]
MLKISLCDCDIKYKEKFIFLKEVDSLVLFKMFNLIQALRIINFLEKLKREVKLKGFLNIKVRKMGKPLELIIKKTQ